MHFDVILLPRELIHIQLRLYVQYRRREEFLYLCNYIYGLDGKNILFFQRICKPYSQCLIYLIYLLRILYFFEQKEGDDF